MTAVLQDVETYLSTYRRDYVERTLEMTGSLPQSIPASVKTSGAGAETSKRPRRRARRPTDTPSLMTGGGGGFMLPGRSLTVGPAPGIPPRAAAHEDERDRQVSEALRIDLPDGDGADYSQWLLSKLPEIVEKCCRQQEPRPRVIEVLPPPVRRKIRINVTANPNGRAGSSAPRPEDRPEDVPDESTEELVLDGAELRRVHRARSARRRRRRRSASSSASSLESATAAHRPSAGDAATAELVRRVLEEMFGPRPGAGSGGGGGGSSNKPADFLSRHRNRSCQTSPRLASGTVNNGSPAEQDSPKAGGGETAAAEAATQSDSPDPSPRQDPSPRRDSSPRRPPPPPPVAARGRSPSPRRHDTSLCILNTLTESNRLLRSMSDFFRRAELNDRITQRADTVLQASPRGEIAESAIKRAEREGRISQRHRTGDGWRFADPPVDIGGGGGGSGGGTTRSDGGIGGFSRGDGPCPEQALRHCSDSELSARIRRYAAAAERGMTVRSWEGERQRQWATGSPPTPPPPLKLGMSSPRPRNGGDSAPSTGRSWASCSAQLLDLHSTDRPYRPLVSPPPRDADTQRTEDGADGAPRTSSPVVAPPQVPQAICSHRQSPEDIDSTDVLLSYDPWQAIENDFKSLLT